MPKSIIATRILLATLSFAALSTGASAATIEKSLEDQFGRATELRIGAGTAALVVVSDQRDAAEQIAAWEAALGAPSASIAVYRIANLKAIPFFVPRGSVTKDLRDKHPGLPLLLDWKGEASAVLGAPRNAVAVMVFGADGSELGRIEGTASPSGALRVKEVLARLN